MNVVACRRRPEMSDNDNLVDQLINSKQIEELMAESDYVVVCAPLTADTVDLIGDKELGASKPGQVIVNIGRGPIVNEAALLRELKPGGRIKGCSLDVFSSEPLPESSKIWDTPNILLSPHNADFTSQSRRKSIRNFVSLCDKVLLGEPIAYADKSLGY